MMKTLLLAALGALVFTGCVDDVRDMKKSSGSATKVTELAIPDSFDWKTTAQVACDFTAPALTRVSVALASDSEPFAEFYAGGDSEQVTIDIPSSVNSLYVGYEKADGGKSGQTVTVKGGKASFAVGEDAAPVMETRANGNDYGVINIPAGNWGTLMFEDMWPSYGDYDFNDFVFNYMIQLYPHNKNKVKELQIGLRVKAIGGSLPFVPRLRLRGVKGGEIREMELLREPGYSTNLPSDAEVVQLNPGNYVSDPAVLEFRNICTKANRPAGAAYLNTERGFESAEGDLITAACFIELRDAVSISDLELDDFDFYIVNPEGKEIHLGGVEPTPEGLAVYNGERENVKMLHASKYYYSTDNLVWAINIPANVAHAYEKVDFLKAYPGFAEWAQSGGQKSQDWYENGVKDNLVRNN